MRTARHPLALLWLALAASAWGADLGPRMALEAEGTLAGDDARSIWAAEAASPRVLDYTFAAAPTDWEPGGGRWEVSSRFSCQPEWSFFGGFSRALCALWNKRDFSDDLAVEMYVGFRHGLPWSKDLWHNYIPTDLNLTLFAAPGDLSTGITFIYSGRSGSTTQIRAGERVLAETSDPSALLPSFTDACPVSNADASGLEYGLFHRRWWRLEARRDGRLLSFSVDGKLLLTAEDPEPERRGRVAVWTVGSGVMIARARLAFTNELAPGPLVLASADPLPLPSAKTP